MNTPDFWLGYIVASVVAMIGANVAYWRALKRHAKDIEDASEEAFHRGKEAGENSAVSTYRNLERCREVYHLSQLN